MTIAVDALQHNAPFRARLNMNAKRALDERSASPNFKVAYFENGPPLSEVVGRGAVAGSLAFAHRIFERFLSRGRSGEQRLGDSASALWLAGVGVRRLEPGALNRRVLSASDVGEPVGVAKCWASFESSGQTGLRVGESSAALERGDQGVVDDFELGPAAAEGRGRQLNRFD